MSWDLSSYFPEFDGPEMRRFKDGLARDIASLKAEATALPPLITESAANWERILLRNEAILQRISHLGSYIGCLASSDARNEFRDVLLREGIVEGEHRHGVLELAELFLRGGTDPLRGRFRSDEVWKAQFDRLCALA